MKHIFIYNPAAGKDNRAAMDRLRKKMNTDYAHLLFEFYPTKAEKDATAFVRARCEAEPDESLRFYACGGDGTANEVLHGIVGFPHASMTCYPCGSGNDYVKYYGGADRFLDIDALIAARETPVDIMQIGDRYSLNVTNFGFDTAVARTMARVKHKKLIGGKHAYTTGIVKALFTSMKNEFTVSVDGELLTEGKSLLCTVSNGKYVGGAYCCAPHSVNDDGFLEICLVKPLSYPSFIRLISKYKNGEHLDDPRFKNIITYRRGKSVHVTAPDGFAYTLDGEIVESSDFTINILPHAIRFAVPASPRQSEETPSAPTKAPEDAKEEVVVG
ncbi:MAG: YegS/Rv2252/BmrU family lipid kinase [Ruminococcaceae bacterium]|nr:YegS/Rv2252/BmrU family lipid kinase [Oscillospiraceae bacterium]